MVLLDGKKVSEEIIEKIKNEIDDRSLKLTLAIIWIGNNESSQIYIQNKVKKCDYVGIKTEVYHLEDGISEKEVLDLINELNNRDDINGIILQSPTPKHINVINCLNKIDYREDVDGFSINSVGNLYLDNPFFTSCTPKGIIRLLEYYGIELCGKNVVIINRSNIVGKPLMHLLLAKDATVTICHSKTTNLEKFTKNADIVITAVGIPNFITKDMIKDNAIVVDVGISRVNGKVVGDVDFVNVAPKTSYISPTPGGVGPMTIAMILENVLKTIER